MVPMKQVIDHPPEGNILINGIINPNYLYIAHHAFAISSMNCMAFSAAKGRYSWPKSG